MKGTQRSEHEYKQHSPACDDARIKLNKSGCRQYFDEHLWLPINWAPDFDCMQFMEMHAPHVACTNNADELKRLYLHDTPMRHSLSEKLNRHRSCFGVCRHAQTHFFTFFLSVTVQPLCAYFALFSLSAILKPLPKTSQRASSSKPCASVSGKSRAKNMRNPCFSTHRKHTASERCGATRSKAHESHIRQH